MSSGKVTCQNCGWSWNKSDSSKKDMYVCHECGKDNSNNMKNGGWLDTYANGGTMQEYQENYNDSSVSLPEGFVGMGNDTKGRNYSPAWGGSFQEGGEIPIAQNGKIKKPNALTSKDSVAHQADKILKYEQLRGGPGGAPLPYYSDPQYMDMLMGNVYPEVQKIMPNASAMEVGEAMDFVFNAGWDKDNNKITKDPRAFALQEYYRQNDPSKLDKDGKWSGRKNAPYSFDQEYANTIGKLPENQRRLLMNKGRDWYYKNINNPSPGVPSSNYNDTWYGRIWNTNDFLPFDPNNPKFTPKKQMGGSVYPVNYVPQAQMGASIPGAVGFSYARVGAPSKGPRRNQTDVTDASAQNGEEMRYYQEGLDWKPKSISKNGGWLDSYEDGGVIKDDMGYWNPDNWGSPVEIGSTDITMEGVYEPLLGISDTGDTKVMKPGKNYKFKGKKVTEYPMAQNGLRQEQKGLVNLDQLTNFTNYNKPQPGGWLNKYN